MVRCNSIRQSAPFLAILSACVVQFASAGYSIQGYDLEEVETRLNMMRNQGAPGWDHGEIIATLEARTTSGCPDPEDLEQSDIMQDRFEEAVREATRTAPRQH